MHRFFSVNLDFSEEMYPMAIQDHTPTFFVDSMTLGWVE